MAAKSKQSFEDAMDRLKEIVERLESGEEPLESSMKLFEEGAKLSAQCYDTLDKAEQKITELEKLEENGEKADE